MPKEYYSRADQDIDREERIKLVEKYLPILSEKLKEEAELLREDGLPLDNNCRIDPSQLVNQDVKYSQEFINQIEKNTSELEDKFRRLNSQPKNKEASDIGELLEIVKTLLFNQDFFGGRIKIVRTAKADDINNGIDEIAFDTKTGFPIGVIDATAGIGSKDYNLEIRMKIGGKLDFGLEMPQKDGKTWIVPRPIEKLPLYIFEMRLNQVLEIARAKATLDYDEDAKKTMGLVERSALQKFIEDGKKILEDKDLSTDMRDKYEEANKIFEEILKSI